MIYNANSLINTISTSVIMKLREINRHVATSKYDEAEKRVLLELKLVNKQLTEQGTTL